MNNFDYCRATDIADAVRQSPPIRAPSLSPAAPI